MDEILPEFRELVDYMKNREKFTKIGAKIPKGILLHGPPGCGKTALVRALSNETNWRLFQASGSEFQDKYIGVGSQKLKELFTQAKKSGPSIIFIDEIDSLGGKRDSKFNYSDQNLNQLLVEMDGYHSTQDLIVIGATNIKDALDPALLRPGRFDKSVLVGLPNKKGRLAIIQHYLSKVRSSYQINKESLSRRTIGLSPADLQNMVNIAAIHAIK